MLPTFICATTRCTISKSLHPQIYAYSLQIGLQRVSQFAQVSLLLLLFLLSFLLLFYSVFSILLTDNSKYFFYPYIPNAESATSNIDIIIDISDVNVSATHTDLVTDLVTILVTDLVTSFRSEPFGELQIHHLSIRIISFLLFVLPDFYFPNLKSFRPFTFLGIYTHSATRQHFLFGKRLSHFTLIHLPAFTEKPPSQSLI